MEGGQCLARVTRGSGPADRRKARSRHSAAARPTQASTSATGALYSASRTPSGIDSRLMPKRRMKTAANPIAVLYGRRRSNRVSGVGGVLSTRVPGQLGAFVEQVLVRVTDVGAECDIAGSDAASYIASAKARRSRM